MNHLVTLLSPSSSLPGVLSYVYNSESQLKRFERLREKSSALTATDSALDAAHSHFRAQASNSVALLDNVEISDTPPPLLTFKDTLRQFGITQNSPGKSEFWKVVEAAALAGAVRRWDSRLQIEAYEATNRKWFLVFDTVTYDPSKFRDDVMFGKHWRRYQRSVQHSIVRRAYGSLRQFRKSNKSFHDHVRYFAVPEAHKDGRTHLHILWFISHLPDSASEADPNAHCPATPRRQVTGWPAYPFGMITMRLPVRYRGDAFTTRLGWRLPLDTDGKRPILKDSVAVARYMAKYLSKPKPETLKCRRIRTSPRLGLQSIQAKLSNLTTPQLCLLYRDPRQNLIQRAIHGIRIPSSLLKIQCLREMSIRFRNQLNQHRGKMRILYDTLKDVLGINSRLQLQEHFSSSTVLTKAFKLQNFIDTLMSTLPPTDISEVNTIFSDYKKLNDQQGHAPSYSPSLGVLQ